MFRKFFIRFGMCLLSLVLCSVVFQADLLAQTTQTITVVDDLKREVTIPFPVTRVAVFNNSNAELFRAVGGSEVFAGMDARVLANRDFWPGFDDSFIIGAKQSQPDYETVVSKKPDIAVFPRNAVWEEAEQKLAPFGIPVVVITGWDIEDFADNVSLIGRMLDKEARVTEFLNFYQDHVEFVESRVRDIPEEDRVTVYFEHEKGNCTVLEGSGHFSMLVGVGGSSIFRELKIGDHAEGSVHLFEIDPEEILLRDPDVIIRDTPVTYPPAGTEEAMYYKLVKRPVPELPCPK